METCSRFFLNVELTEPAKTTGCVLLPVRVFCTALVSGSARCWSNCRFASCCHSPTWSSRSLSGLMGRSEKSGRRGQFFTGFKRIVVLFAPKTGEKLSVFPLFAADLIKSDRLLGQLTEPAAVLGHCHRRTGAGVLPRNLRSIAGGGRNQRFIRTDHRLGAGTLQLSWQALCGRPGRPAVCLLAGGCRSGIHPHVFARRVFSAPGSRHTTSSSCLPCRASFS